MKPAFFRGIVGNAPDPGNLAATHVHLKDIEADDPEDALARMHVDNWSANADLIQSKGLEHASMTVGDVLVDEAEIVHQVTAIGFSRLAKT
jgi:hypothetical protein